MNVFEILGPAMVGPSSSHTAGAARIGYICGKLMGEKSPLPISGFTVLLLTGKGHGTPQALIAGLLGMQPDDERIPKAFEIAEKRA